MRVCLVGYQSFNDVIAKGGWREEGSAFYTQVYFAHEDCQVEKRAAGSGFAALVFVIGY